MSEAQSDIRRPPPTAGQHTAEILTEIGYDEARIQTLASQGVI